MYYLKIRTDDGIHTLRVATVNKAKNILDKLLNDGTPLYYATIYDDEAEGVADSTCEWADNKIEEMERGRERALEEMLRLWI